MCEAAMTTRPAPKPTVLNREAIFADHQGARRTNAMAVRLGFDEGGTDTDAVLLLGESLVNFGWMYKCRRALWHSQRCKSSFFGSNAGTVVGRLDTSTPDFSQYADYIY